MGSPAWFQNATRYHEGGIAGLKPGEMPAILKKGEIIDPGDGSIFGPLMGAAKPQPAPQIKVVNTIDAGDFVSQGLGTKTGETAFMNFIRANSRAVKNALG